MDWVFASIAFIAMIFACWVMWSQQRTIDRLTNKLMSKDYGEYKRHEKQVERESAPKRKPMSYHDDDSVDLED
ncbi:hypothetical protein [Paenibacillus sinopodophylli]|uniref:hypothetical protein n=1 Tax=Paenibacillus sinopodophylli TaxID=1837342 RepID=UPI00110CB648|nr:hypothetical protein [Paenibacillus sinopodophylli]